MCTCISQASATLHAEHTSQFMLIMMNNFQVKFAACDTACEIGAEHASTGP